MYNVLIRPLITEDAEKSFAWRNDPEIWEFTGKKPDRIITKEIEDSWIRKVLAEKDSCRFAIEVDRQYVGNIQITNIKAGYDGQYHIFLGEKKFWGKGIATLATYQILRFAKEVLKLQQVYLFVNPLNSAAIRVYEKCGFVKCSDKNKMIFDLTKSLNPTVSVLMITYNHEQSIIKAIDSILTQRTNFDYDIIIGEDCSTDNTRTFIKQIADKYPGKFKLLFHEKNVGAVANQEYVFKTCTAKYIALCEGDDYWINSDKLQKQVDFLNKNPDFGLVSGNALVSESSRELYPKTPPKALTFEAFLKSNPLITASTCFRKNLYDRFVAETSEVSKEWVMGDYPLYLWMLNNSKIYHFDDFFAVYSVQVGSSTGFSSFKKGEHFILAVIKIKTYFYSYYSGHLPLREFVKREYESLFKLSIHYGIVLKCIKYFPVNYLENIKFLNKLIKFKI